MLAKATEVQTVKVDVTLSWYATRVFLLMSVDWIVSFGSINYRVRSP